MGKRVPRATMAGVPRSRARQTREQRKTNRWFNRVVMPHAKEILARLYRTPTAHVEVQSNPKEPR